MSKSNDKLRQIVTDALVGMISGVTGLVPPTGPGSIPDFVQAPIDRAVEKISASLPMGVPVSRIVEAGERLYSELRQWMATESDPDSQAALQAWRDITAPTVKESLSVQPVKAAPDDSLTAAVDAAMVEMRNISPPLRRSECERLIRAALPALRAQ